MFCVSLRKTSAVYLRLQGPHEERLVQAADGELHGQGPAELPLSTAVGLALWLVAVCWEERLERGLKGRAVHDSQHSWLTTFQHPNLYVMKWNKVHLENLK